jgi:lipopolysaccharide biosynthesis glycosyltransferase
VATPEPIPSLTGRITVPVLTCFDNNYVIPASVAFRSLVEHAERSHHYLIHVLHSDISPVNQQRLAETIAEFGNAEIRFMDMQGVLQDLFHVTRAKNHYSKEMFYKLLAPSIFPQHDKMLVTDVDVVFLGDVSRDYLEFDIRADIYLAGSLGLVRRDSWVDRFKRNYEAAFTPDEIARLRIGANYYVANLAKMRRDSLEEQFRECAWANAHRVVQPEQDVLNLICHPKIRILPVDSMVCTYSYDFYRTDQDLAEDLTYPADEVKRALDHPVQLHYAGGAKPWNRPDSPKSEVWFEILARTPFLRDQLVAMSRKLNEDEEHRKLITQLRQGIEARDATIVQLREEIEARGASIEGLKADISAVRQSTSWKLTAPLRLTIHLFRLGIAAAALRNKNFVSKRV